MAFRDKATSWFIRNILLPKYEIIDNPGFVVTTFTEHNKKKYLRDLFIPEDLFVEIEKEIVAKFGEKGKQSLYSAGKKFAYGYASMSNFPTRTTVPSDDFKKFARFLIGYVNCMYATNLSEEMKIEKEMFKIKMDDYIICRKNGQGQIMTEGAIAGMWAYAIDDKTIEGVQTKCEGRGDGYCEMICAPSVYLKEQKLNFLKETNLIKQPQDYIYKQMNSIQKTAFAKNSLKALVDSGFFTYKGAVLKFKEERHFYCESHILYIIEKELEELKGGKDCLFNASFRYGKNFAQKLNESNFSKFIMDYLPALGYGDILIKKEAGKYIVLVNYFPWTKLSSNSKYVIFRGMLSGMLSGFLGKEINLKMITTNTKQGYLGMRITS